MEDIRGVRLQQMHREMFGLAIVMEVGHHQAGRVMFLEMKTIIQDLILESLIIIMVVKAILVVGVMMLQEIM